MGGGWKLSPANPRPTPWPTPLANPLANPPHGGATFLEREGAAASRGPWGERWGPTGGGPRRRGGHGEPGARRRGPTVGAGLARKCNAVSGPGFSFSR